jgi:hypothetical protein
MNCAVGERAKVPPMKDLVVGLAVWATVVAAILVIAPKSQTAVSQQLRPAQRLRPTAGDLLRVHDQQIVNSMILTSGNISR